MTAQVQYDPQPVEQMPAAVRKRRKPRRHFEGGTLRHRIQKTFSYPGQPWWDWGHKVMTLVGRWDGTGDYSIPRGRDLWYYETGRGKIHTTYEFAELREPWGDRAWKVFDIQNDGFELHMGYWPEPGSHGNIKFYDLSRHELKLFRRWDFWECRVRAEWFGLRRWIYYKALHAAVNRKRPFACNFTPPKGSGGYDHWHCQLKPSHRRRGEPHRFNSYTFPLEQEAYRG